MVHYLMRKGLFSSALCAFHLFTPAFSVQAFPTLGTSFESAKKNDAQYLAAVARSQSAFQALPQAIGQLLPNVALTGNRFQIKQDRSDDGQAFPRQSYISEGMSLTIRQPLFNPRLFSERNRAEFLVQNAQWVLALEQQDLSNRVASVYVNLLAAAERVNALRAQMQLVSARAKAAERAWRLGTGTKTDLSEVGAQEDLLQVQLLEARQTLLSAKLDFERVTGLPVDSQFTNADLILPDRTVFQMGTLDDWVEKLLKQSPEVLARSAQVEVARAALQSSEREHMPTVEILAQSSYSSGENSLFTSTETTSHALGLQFTFPLYQGGGIRSRNRQAAADLRAAEEQYSLAVASARVALARAYYAVQEGLLRIDALDRAVSSAKDVVVANEKSFQAGIRSTLDILSADQRLAQVQFESVQTKLRLVLDWVRLHSLVNEVTTEALAIFGVSTPETQSALVRPY